MSNERAWYRRAGSAGKVHFYEYQPELQGVWSLCKLWELTLTDRRRLAVLNEEQCSKCATALRRRGKEAQQ